MKYYMAPMEGLTGYIYRNAYQKYFHDIDRYFTPFITNKKLDFKVKKDIDPEHNQGMEVVPQILTNQPDDFISIVNQLISWTVFLIKFSMHVTVKFPSKLELEKIHRRNGKIFLLSMRNIRCLN